MVMLEAVPDLPRTAPAGCVGAVLVERASMVWQGDVGPAWRLSARGVDGTGRDLSARAFRDEITDGQAVAEGWAETHRIRVVWDVLTPGWAVGFLLPADDGDEG